MTFRLNGTFVLVMTLLYYWLASPGYVSGMETRITLKPKVTTFASSRKVFVTCKSATNVGDILALFLETSPHAVDNYEKQFTYDKEGINWSKSSQKQLRTSSKLVGNVTTSSGWFEINLRRLKCTSSAKFRCVTSGRLSSSTSLPIDVQIVDMPQSVYISQTTTLGSKYIQTLQPSSSVFYKKGEVVLLTCSARLGEPLTWSTFHWYKLAANEDKTLIMSTVAARYGDKPSSGVCRSFRGFSNIIYNPDPGDIETEILCEVHFKDPTFPEETDIKSSSVNLYLYGTSPPATSATPEGQSVGILVGAIVGSIFGAIVVCVIVFLLLRACGCRCKSGTSNKENKTKMRVSSRDNTEYQNSNGGHPIGMSDTSNRFYEDIRDHPSYEVPSLPPMDNHGYVDLNHT